MHKLFRIPISINNHSSHALVDTGAAASFISSPLFSQLAPDNISQEQNSPTPKFKTASGNIIEPLGYYSTPIRLGNQLTIQHPFYIIPKLEESCI